MAHSPWKTPGLAQEIDQQEIEVTGTGVRNWTSTQPVKSISTSFGTFEKTESNAVFFRNFGFDPGVVVGIEVKLRVSRLARIQDKTIQLAVTQDYVELGYAEPGYVRNISQEKIAISENRADLAAEDENIYGGDFDRWGITSDKAIPIESEQFGVIIDLKPHESIPSSETVYIRSVSMRVHYAQTQDYVEPGYVEPGYVQNISQEKYVEPGYVEPGYVRNISQEKYVEPGYVEPGYVRNISQEKIAISKPHEKY